MVFLFNNLAIMKNIFLLVCSILLMAVSCQKQELSPSSEVNGNDLYASIEAMNSTRTSMDQNNNVIWSEGDELIAFMKTTLSSRYQIKEQYIGSNSGGFSKVSYSYDGDELLLGQELDHNVILYPYSSAVSCAKNDNVQPTSSYKINVNLPEVQTYASNSFGNGSFPMVAVSSDNRLTFRNVCGGLKFSFNGVDKIKSIKVESLGDEAISGNATVIAYSDNVAPAISMSASSANAVTLDCGSGVQLKESEPVAFIVAVPPVQFASGIKITVTDCDGLSMTLFNTSSNQVNRSRLLNFPVITYVQDAVMELLDGTYDTYDVSDEGGNVEIALRTNQTYDIVIPADARSWISHVRTKALREETITLSVLENTTKEDRSAEVQFVSTDGNIVQTVTINQQKSQNNPADNQIFYKATAKCTPNKTDVFGANITSNEWDSATGKGVITFDAAVNKIGNSAFENSSVLTSIYLPDSVTELGSNAFEDCRVLTTISFGSNLEVIGYCCFYDCWDLKNIKIPDSVTEILGWAFCGCESFTDIIVPDSVTSMADGAFYRCLELQNVVLSKNITAINKNTFDGCVKLQSIDIPDGVTAIGSEAFDECQKMTSVRMPDSVLSIGDNAFYNCKSLSDIYLSSNLKSLGTSVFVNCTSLREFNSNLSSADKRCLVINQNLIAFAPGGLTSYTVPSGVTGISSNAFAGCNSLIDIYLGDQVTTIGAYAFSGCSQLISITLPDTVTKIGDNAFRGCSKLSKFYGKYASEDNRCLVIDGVLKSFASSGLTSYTIPDSITSIGDNAFSSCTNLKTVTLHSNIGSIGKSAFSNCKNLSSLNLNDGISYIGEAAFYYCTALTSITIPNGITTIEADTFFNCSKLASITIPGSVKEIKSSAFSNFSGTRNLYIEDLSAWCNIKFAGDSSNPMCNGATLYINGVAAKDITIPSDVTTIKSYAFRGCSSLTTVRLESNVTSIGESAFENCINLSKVYCNCSTPPTGAYDMFYRNASSRKIYVPSSYVNKYKQARYWSDYSSYIESYAF